MYKQACRTRLRFATNKGPLSVEQVWDLSISSLAILARALKKELKKDNDDELSFLDSVSKPVDKVLQLKFDIIKDIFLTKSAERDAAVENASKKAELEKLLEIKAKRIEESKEKMSDEDLDKQIEALSNK